MPAITAPGTYGPNDPGFEFLKKSSAYRNGFITLKFSGVSLGTETKLQYLDSNGDPHDIENGVVGVLPWTRTLENWSDPLQIVVTGAPNFVVN